MSRIGNRILTIPEGVTITTDGNIVTVSGPKGQLSTEINSHITVKQEGNELKVLFDNKVAAVAPGQSVVFYQGSECLGGAIINTAIKE